MLYQLAVSFFCTQWCKLILTCIISIPTFQMTVLKQSLLQALCGFNITESSFAWTSAAPSSAIPQMAGFPLKNDMHRRDFGEVGSIKYIWRRAIFFAGRGLYCNFRIDNCNNPFRRSNLYWASRVLVDDNFLIIWHIKIHKNGVNS